MTKFRLLKVVCQPVFVIDDGETLTEQAAQPVEVRAADWPEFPIMLEHDRLKHEATLNEQVSADD